MVPDKSFPVEFWSQEQFGTHWVTQLWIFCSAESLQKQITTKKTPLRSLKSKLNQLKHMNPISFFFLWSSACLLKAGFLCM